MVQMPKDQVSEVKDECTSRLYRYKLFTILAKQFLRDQLLSETEYDRTLEEAKKFYRIKDRSDD